MTRLIKKGLRFVKQCLRFVKRCLQYLKRKILRQPPSSEVPAQEAPAKVRKDCDYSGRNSVISIQIPSKRISTELEQSVQIAVQIHIYFAELAEEILENINKIPYPFDCYISTDTKEKKEQIEKVFEGTCRAANICIEVIENRGRDVGPFLQQISDRHQQYKYIGHFHTKKSKHTEFGDGWRYFLYRNLLGSSAYLKTIFDAFEEDSGLGMILPEIYPLIQEFVAWDGAKEEVDRILRSLGLCPDLPEVPMFPAGNMFWARTEAIAPLLGKHYTTKDFPLEEGQLNLTLAHCVERIWVYLLEAQGYSYQVWENRIPPQIPLRKKTRMIYGKADEKRSVESVWAEQLKACTEEELRAFDQTAFVDESYIGPVFSIESVFERMEEQVCDYWNVMSCMWVIQNQKLLEIVRQKGAEGFSLLKRRSPYVHKEYILESPFLAELMHVKDAEKELPYEIVLLGSPWLHPKYARYQKPNEAVRMKEYLQQLENGRKAADETDTKTGISMPDF